MSKQLFMSIREQEVHADAQNGVFEDDMFSDFGSIFSPVSANSVTLNLNEERSI